MGEIFRVNLLSGKCHLTLLMMSQHWFGWLLGAAREQVIIWAHADPVLCHRMTSRGQNEFEFRCHENINDCSTELCVQLPDYAVV